MLTPPFSPQLEFAVQMSCHGCADAVRAALDAAPGETPDPPLTRGPPPRVLGDPRHPLCAPPDVKLLELRPQEQSVLVETTAAAERVRELLENSGCRAVLKGMGGSSEGQ